LCYIILKEIWANAKTDGGKRPQKEMNMKKKLLVVAALVCGLIATTCDLFKEAVKEPDVSLKSVDFSDICFEGLTLQSTVNVKNENSIDIPLPKIDWDLSVINNPFLNGTIESDGSLKSNDSTEVKFPVSFTYENLINTIIAVNNNDNAQYKINMTLHIPVQGLGDLSWTFGHEGKIPILRVPDITIATAPKATITYGSGILPNGGKIEFSLNVKNNSNISVTVNDLSCVLKIGGTPLTVGVTGKPNIGAKSTQKIDFSFPLTASEIASVGINVLTGTNLEYSLTGNYKFGLPDFPFLNEVGDSFTF